MPKLQLQQIKKKHRDRVSSTEQSRTEPVSTDTPSEPLSSQDESDSGEMEGEGEGTEGEVDMMEGQLEFERRQTGEVECERREIVPIIDSDSDSASSPVYITAREEHTTAQPAGMCYIELLNPVFFAALFQHYSVQC